MGQWSRSLARVGGQWAVLAVSVGLAVWVGLYLVARRLVGDAVWQLRAGQWQLRHGRVLSHNIFTWTLAGRPWINMEWGYDWAFAHLWAVGPWMMVVAVMAAGAAFVWGLAVLARLQGVPWGWVAGIVALGALLSAPWWSFRPQVFIYPLVVWWLVLVWWGRARPGLGRWWMVAAWLVELVAVQVEGSWLLFLVWAVVEVVFAWRDVGHWLFLLGTWLVPVINPWGVAGYYHEFWLVGNPWIGASIGEWLPPDLGQWANILTLWPVLVVGMVGVLWLRPKWRWRSAVYFGGCGLAVLHAWRFEFLGGVALVALAGMVRRWPSFGRWGSSWWSVVVGGAVVVLVAAASMPVAVAASIPKGARWLSPSLEPRVALAWVADHAGARKVWAWEYWSTGLEWYGRRAWVDGRADFFLAYRDHVWQSYVEALSGTRSVLPIVKGSGATWLLVPRVSLFAVEARGAGWPVVWRGQVAEVFRVR